MTRGGRDLPPTHKGVRTIMRTTSLTIAFCALLPLKAGAQALPWISEETGPAVCARGYALSKFQCRGSYCDDIQATCTRYADPPAVPSAQPTYWTAWFSEEKKDDVIDGSNFPKLLNGYSIAIGLQCRGRYCDDIRLLMQPLSRTRRPRETPLPLTPTMDSKSDYPDCRLSSRFSEEVGAAVPSPNPPIGMAKEFVRRVGCSGRYCDNIQVEWCKVFTPVVERRLP